MPLSHTQGPNPSTLLGTSRSTPHCSRAPAAGTRFIAGSSSRRAGPRTTLHRSRAHSGHACAQRAPPPPPTQARLGRGRAGRAGGGGGRSGSGVRGWCAARAARRRVQRGAEVVLAAGTLWGCSVVCGAPERARHEDNLGARCGCARAAQSVQCGARGPSQSKARYAELCSLGLHALRSARAPHS
jgi:hypothetical protein